LRTQSAALDAAVGADDEAESPLEDETLDDETLDDESPLVLAYPSLYQPPPRR
jgi:hypothetical protein